ncbi:hypothetical protein VTN02DRAFT_6747 [Thermoascus thermophilus]
MPRASRLPSQPTPTQAGIQRFARAAKPGVAGPDQDQDVKPKGKGKSETAGQGPAQGLPPSPSKKRKLNEIAGAGTGSGDDEETQRQGGADAPATPSKTLRFSRLSLSTPRGSRGGLRRSSTVTAQTTTTTTKTARTGVQRSLPPSRSLPVLAETDPASTSSTSSSSPTPTPPPSFDDLLRLHRAVVQALSLHFAHNGPATPADLREFLPSVGRIWKKRKVVTTDLQRLIRVWDDEDEPDEEGDGGSTVPRFRIANYGLGKVCLERVGGQSVPAGPLNEHELQERFARKLEGVWRRVVDASSSSTQPDRDDFLEKLPLAPIHESFTPFTSLRKGQQRLQDLKGVGPDGG